MNRQIFLAFTAVTLAANTLAGQTDSDTIKLKLKIAAEKAAQAARSETELALMGTVVRNQPYTADATTETDQTLADGSHVRRQSSSTVYRDSEGRIRREVESNQVVLIVDPVAGASYTLHVPTKEARKMPLGRSAASNRGATYEAKIKAEERMRVDVLAGRVQESADPKLAVKEDLGTQTIEGVSAVGTRTTVTIPQGSIGNDRPLQIVSERWYSPELQVVVMSRHTDPRSGENVSRLKNIRRSQPDPALFQVPPGYQLSGSNE
jgi:hypothetical protein